MSVSSFSPPAAGAGSIPPANVYLAAGAPVCQQGSHSGLWRVVSGVVRLDQRGKDSAVLVSLALPGDLIGFETLLNQAHSFDASVLIPATLRPLVPDTPADHQALLIEALLQQPQRSHDMARVRTGPVVTRVGEMLRLLGFMPAPAFLRSEAVDPDALRSKLPPLRVLAEVVDAKAETVCRALAQLLPPRTRKSGPKSLASRVQDALMPSAQGSLA